MLPFESWYKAIEARRSRRTFISKAIETEVINSLNERILKLNKQQQGVRLKLVEQSPDKILCGVVGPYGKITGALFYIAVVVKHPEKSLVERGGYIGQAIALEATVQGLASCWVGGTFKDVDQQVDLLDEETIISVLPFGYARKNYSLTEKMMNQVGDFHKRKPLEEIVDGLQYDKWPEWLKSTIHMARLAPSAYNRQPIRYTIGEDYSIALTIDDPHEETKVPKEIDQGIVMLHIDLSLKQFKIHGQWHYDQKSNVVVFKEFI